MGAARALQRRDRPQLAREPGHPPTHAAERVATPARPVATTDVAGTTVAAGSVPPGRMPEVLAHERVHAAQFARGAAGDAPAHEEALEAEARAGSRALLAGGSFTPALAARPGHVLHFGPEDWFPPVAAQGDVEATALQGAGLTNPATVTTAFTTASEGVRRGIEYRNEVAAAGAAGSVITTTVLTLSYDPERTVDLVGPARVRLNPELGLGPVTTVPALPYALTYDRVITYTDRDGRVADVQVTGRVWFSELTWAEQVGRATPSFDALLGLAGDRGEFTARLTGSGPVTPYWVDLSSDATSVQEQTQTAVETFFGGPGSRYAAVRRAAFLHPSTTAGEQFTSLRAALQVVDAITLARRSAAQVDDTSGSALADLVAAGLASILGPVFEGLHEFGTWLDELIPEPPEWFVGAMTAAMEGLAWLGAEVSAWWRSLDPRLRGVLKAVGWFVVGLLGVAAIALVVVAAAEALGVALAFGTAMLIVGAVLLAATYVYSFVMRTIEAVTLGTPLDVLVVPTVALMDTVGISAIVEAFTNESVLTGHGLGRNVEERWEGGTSGVLQLVSLILMARGLRAPAPRGAPAEVTWRGNAGEFRTLPRERLGRLPEGHAWRRTGSGEWVIERAPDAPAVPLEVTVSADAQGRVTHVVRSGDTVLHSDTMPRAVGDTRTSGPRLPPELEGVGAENPYRVPGEPSPMDKGHLGDFADVYEGPTAHNLNTDPANFTPQARWWNRWVRNHLVQAIRLRGGGYREIPIYDAVPRVTADGTPIPAEYVFVETNSAGAAVRAWRVPNNNALTARTQAVLPQYAIPLDAVPQGLIAPDGAVARPGAWVAGVQVIGQLGRDEEGAQR
jgi:hypothetical protein